MKFPKLILFIAVIPLFYSCSKKQVKASYELDSLLLPGIKQDDFFKVYKKADFKFTAGEDSVDAVMLAGTAREVALKWDFLSDGKWLTEVTASKPGWYSKAVRVPVGADFKTLADSLKKPGDSVELVLGGAHELIYPTTNRGSGEQTLFHFSLPAGSEELKANEKYSITTPFIVKLNPVITSITIIIAQHAPTVMLTDADDPSLGEGDAGMSQVDELEDFFNRVNSKKLELPLTLAKSESIAFDPDSELKFDSKDQEYLPLLAKAGDDTVANDKVWVYGSFAFSEGKTGVIWAIQRKDVSLNFSIVDDDGKTVGVVTQLNYANNNPGNCTEHHNQITTVQWNDAKDAVLIRITDNCTTTCPGATDVRYLRKFSIKISKDGTASDLQSTEKKL